MSADVLVVGVGNVFFGDDGFGVEVVRRLMAERVPSGVEVADYGIRGVHLAYRLIDPPRLLVLVDALTRGGEPGTLYVMDPEIDAAPGHGIAEGHAIDVASVLAAARALGGELRAVRIVGCEPGELAPRIGLGPAVERAVPQALGLVREIVDGHLASLREAEVEREGDESCGAGTGTGTEMQS